MSEQLNPVIVQRTQQKLGKFIQRPQLTDKLLKRPPFRFLHDIVTTVSSTMLQHKHKILKPGLFTVLTPTCITGNQTVWSIGWHIYGT